MLIEKNYICINISEIVDGYLLSRRYIGYTIQEATRQFKAEIKRQKKWDGLDSAIKKAKGK